MKNYTQKELDVMMNAQCEATASRRESCKTLIDLYEKGDTDEDPQEYFKTNRQEKPCVRFDLENMYLGRNDGGYFGKLGNYGPYSGSTESDTTTETLSYDPEELVSGDDVGNPQDSREQEKQKKYEKQYMKYAKENYKDANPDLWRNVGFVKTKRETN